MIELDKLLQLAKNMRVSLDVMIMEAYQMLLLNDISESAISKNLIFKVERVYGWDIKLGDFPRIWLFRG